MCEFYFDSLHPEDTDHLQFTVDELNETLSPIPQSTAEPPFPPINITGPAKCTSRRAESRETGLA